MKGRTDVEISGKKHMFNFDIPLLVEKTEGHNKYTVAIELAGPVTAIRAAWATLVKNREADVIHSSGVYAQYGGDWNSVYVLGKRKLKKIEEGGHILLLAQEITTQRICFLGGTPTEPSPFFMDSLRHNVHKVPVLREWAQELWTRGISAGAILSLTVHGSDLNAWQLGPGWGAVVKDMVLAWRS